MILRFVASVLLCMSMAFFKEKEDLVQWNLNNRLTWEDFKGLVPENATNAALTSSRVLLKFSLGAVSFDYTISCDFNRKSSWVRIKNDHILSHEQGHFDITEIYARRLNKALRAYHARKNYSGKEVNAIYQDVMNQLSQVQNLYDEETDNSRNFVQQKNWLLKISKELNSLQEYAAYK